MTGSVERASMILPVRNFGERINELAMLHSIACAILSETNLDNVLAKVVDAAVYLAAADEAYIILADEAEGGLFLRAQRKATEKKPRILKSPLSDETAQQALASGKTLQISIMPQDSTSPAARGTPDSLLLIPIKVGENYRSLLYVSHLGANRERLKDYHLSLLASLIEYASQAIHNAQRMEAANRQLAVLSQELQGARENAALLAEKQSQLETLRQHLAELNAQHEEILSAQQKIWNAAIELRSHADTAQALADKLAGWDTKITTLAAGIEKIEGTPSAAAPMPTAAPSAPQPEIKIAGFIDTLSPLINFMEEGCILAEAKGKIIYANEAAYVILNESSESLIAKDLADIIPDSRWGNTVGSLRLLMALGDEKQLPASYPPLSLIKNKKALHARVIPVINGRMKERYLMAFLRDMSREDMGWRLRDETVAYLSERLRTPLTAISGYTDMLLNSTTTELGTNKRFYAERIRQNLQHILKALGMINQTASDQYALAYTSKEEMNKAVKQIIGFKAEELALTGISLVSTLPASLPDIQIQEQNLIKILNDMIELMEKKTSVGETIEISGEVEDNGNEPGHLVIRMKGGSAPVDPQEAQELEEKFTDIRRFVEEQHGRIWLDKDETGRDLQTLLAPLSSKEKPASA